MTKQLPEAKPTPRGSQKNVADIRGQLIRINEVLGRRITGLAELTTHKGKSNESTVKFGNTTLRCLARDEESGGNGFRRTEHHFDKKSFFSDRLSSEAIEQSYAGRADRIQEEDKDKTPTCTVEVSSRRGKMPKNGVMGMFSLGVNSTVRLAFTSDEYYEPDGYYGKFDTVAGESGAIPLQQGISTAARVVWCIKTAIDQIEDDQTRRSKQGIRQHFGS